MISRGIRRSIASSRRVVAAVLILCMMCMTAESMKVDVCSEELSHATNADVQLLASQASTLDHSDDIAPGDQKSSDMSGTGGAGAHPSMHVCHCLHGHFGALLPSPHSLGVYLAVGAAFYEVSAALPDVAFTPPHRPPLA